MDIHTQLRKKYLSAITTACKRLSCRLGLKSVPSDHRTIIDTDKYIRITGFKGKMCDYFLFLTDGGLIVVVVEMKSGGVDASEAVKQIVNGAKECKRLLESQPVSAFYPVLLYGKIQHASELKVLREERVRFRTRGDHEIIYERCGIQLREIMKKYPPS